MIRLSRGDWARLETLYPKSLVSEIRRLLHSTELVNVDPAVLAARMDGCTAQTATTLLAELHRMGAIEQQLRWHCAACGEALDDAEVQRTPSCLRCNAPFVDNPPRSSAVYFRDGLRSRDPLCVFTIHGMNTDGSWQQDYEWHLYRIYGYAIPVDIQKYGRMILGPFFGWLQRRAGDRYVEHLRERMRDLAAIGRREPPDLIAHSFGTWLIAYALQNDPALQFGRIVLVGSIVRPDFDWRALIERGQVGAVFCHTAGRDVWVPRAEYAFPETGPSGTRGFTDRQHIIHRHDPNFGHGDALSKAHLGEVMQRLWGPFLESVNLGPGSPPGLETPVGKPWRPTVWFWPLRIITGITAALIVIAMLQFVVFR